MPENESSLLLRCGAIQTPSKQDADKAHPRTRDSRLHEIASGHSRLKAPAPIPNPSLLKSLPPKREFAICHIKSAGIAPRWLWRFWRWRFDFLSCLSNATPELPHLAVFAFSDDICPCHSG